MRHSPHTHAPPGRTPSQRTPRKRPVPSGTGARAPLDALRHEHLNFEKLLRIFESELTQFHDAGLPDYGIMRDVMHYVTNYPDRAHHPTEELIFERLLRADSAARAPVEQLRRQHRWLTDTGIEILHLLDEIVADVPMAREPVESLAREYVQALRAHMELEESTLFPLAASRLSPDDWRAVAAAARRLPDPLFGNEPADQEYREIRERLTAA